MGQVAQRGFLLLLVVVFTIGAATSTAKLDMQFYSAVSQVIPLLFIVLAVEVRLFQLAPGRAIGSFRDDDTKDALVGLMLTVVLAMVLLFMLAGEYWALRPLWTGDAADGSPQIVRTSAMLGFVAIGYLAVFGQRDVASDAR